MKRKDSNPRSDKFQVHDALIPQLESMAAVGMTITQICHVLGISDQTLLRRRGENPAIDEALKRGKARQIHKMAQKLVDLGEAGDLGAIIFYLKAQAGWRDRDPTVNVNVLQSAYGASSIAELKDDQLIDYLKGALEEVQQKRLPEATETIEAESEDVGS